MWHHFESPPAPIQVETVTHLVEKPFPADDRAPDALLLFNIVILFALRRDCSPIGPGGLLESPCRCLLRHPVGRRIPARRRTRHGFLAHHRTGVTAADSNFELAIAVADDHLRRHLGQAVAASSDV